MVVNKMNTKKLISFAELARELNVSRAYIAKLKKNGTLKLATENGKVVLDKALKILGKSKSNNTDITTINTLDEMEIKKQITDILNDPNNINDKSTLDGAKSKAEILKKFWDAKQSELEYKKIADNLFSYDEIMKVIQLATSELRNSLLRMPDNFASNLEHLDRKEIKEYVLDYINTTLEDFVKLGNKFKNQ